jgi:polar amino acid transport system substrate-binding protein
MRKTVFTLSRRAPRFLRAAAWMTVAMLAAPAVALDITTEDNAPFNYADGQRITGISTEIVMEMGKRAKVPMNIQLTPWARAYQAALNSANHCVYSAARLPEREALFKWVGPIATNKWALFAKSDFNKPINTLEDAKVYRIGGVNTDAKSLYLKSLGFTNFELVGDDNLNLVKLMTGRIDLWVAGLYRVKELSAEGGVKNVKPVFVVREVDYFLACNPKTPDATIKALSNALQSLQKEGHVKAVTDRYASRLK